MKYIKNIKNIFRKRAEASETEKALKKWRVRSRSGLRRRADLYHRA